MNDTQIDLEQCHADDWFGVHVFLSDAAQANRFLLDWVGPSMRALLTEGAARGWFFLRYWEGGPHLRVRVQGLAPGQRLRLLEAVRAVAPGFASAQPPQRDDYYRHHFFDGQSRDPATLPWFDEGSVEAVPYAPEWRRYGGLHGMPVNENLFDLSSTLALGLMRAAPGEPAHRLAQAASLMPLFALAWRPGCAGVQRFCADYAAYWEASSPQLRAFKPAGPAAAPSHAACAALQRQIEAARADPPRRSAGPLLMAGLDAAVQQWSMLRDSGALLSPVTGVAVADPTDHERSLQAMLASQLHMFNNRLGLVPLQEVVLARSLARTAAALQREAEAEPEAEAETAAHAA